MDIYFDQEAEKVLDLVMEERNQYLDVYVNAIKDKSVTPVQALLAMWKLGVEHGEREFADVHMPMGWENEGVQCTPHGSSKAPALSSRLIIEEII